MVPWANRKRYSRSKYARVTRTPSRTFAGSDDAASAAAFAAAVAATLAALAIRTKTPRPEVCIFGVGEAAGGGRVRGF